jgi:ferric-dicitrate binding protein FerR (iron transport regulator)
MDPRREQIVRDLVRELSEQPTPELDWDRLERNVDREIGTAPPAAAARGARPGRFVGALAVAALAASIVAVIWPRPAPPVVVVGPSSAPVATPRAVPVVDGVRLPSGSEVASGADALEVVHGGRVSWTLAPHSRARLLVAGEDLVVRLESGSVRAVVTRHEPREWFAVEVGLTRVAARGTAFRVTLEAARAAVEVDEGTVVVGPVPLAGPGRVWSVTAPARGRFSLDGGRQASIDGVPQEPRSPPVTPPRLQPARDTQVSPAAVTPGADPPLSETLSLTEADAGTALVISLVEQCFARHTGGAGNVRITAEPTLTSFVAPDGTLRRLDIEPPLAPLVQQCVAAGLSEVRFAPSRDGATLVRVLELRR